MTPEQYTILENEISNDPLSRGYASMTDQEVADDLNTAYRTKPDHSHKFLRDVAAATTDFDTLLPKLEAVTTPSVVEALVAMRTYAESGGLDFAHAKTIAMLNQLATSGVITTAERDELLSLGKQPATRAEELGLPKPEAGHIASARKLLAGGQ